MAYVYYGVTSGSFCVLLIIKEINGVLFKQNWLNSKNGSSVNTKSPPL